MFIYSLSFLLYFILFIFAVVVAFTIPGDLVLGKLRISRFQRVVLGTVVGMIIWGWQGWIFGYLDARWATYVYLLAALSYWFYLNWRKVLGIQLNIVRPKKSTILLMLLVVGGVFVQLSTVWFTGVMVNDGMYFCCANLFDSMLHIALTDSIVRSIPPFE